MHVYRASVSCNLDNVTLVVAYAAAESKHASRPLTLFPPPGQELLL
jgi:hypothetical protein